MMAEKKICRNSRSKCSIQRHSGITRTPKIESFATIVNGWKPLNIVAKLFIFDVCKGSWLRLCYWKAKEFHKIHIKISLMESFLSRCARATTQTLMPTLRRLFTVNCVELLRAASLQNTCEWLLLIYIWIYPQYQYVKIITTFLPCLQSVMKVS